MQPLPTATSMPLLSSLHNEKISRRVALPFYGSLQPANPMIQPLSKRILMYQSKERSAKETSDIHGHFEQ
jgi:hypothetical protein